MNIITNIDTEEFYEKTGINNPTQKQCLDIEVNFIMDELKSKKYNTIYSKWKKGNKTAYDAGYLFCTQYEKPKDMYIEADERGNEAKKIYNVIKNNIIGGTK